MGPEAFDDAWLDVFAETCARLATPFADRGAVLWRAGFDEASWSRFEGVCLVAIGADSADPDRARAGRFADAFVRTRRMLTDPTMPFTVRRSEDEPTLPWTTLVSPPEPEPPPAEVPPTRPLDLLQAMTTLASNPGTPEEPSTGKRG